MTSSFGEEDFSCTVAIYVVVDTSLFILLIHYQILRRNLRPLMVKPGGESKPFKPLYDVIGTILSVSVVNYLAAPFIILHFWDSLYAWYTVYFYGLVFISTPMIVQNVGGFK